LINYDDNVLVPVWLKGVAAEKWKIVAISSQIRGQWWTIGREFAQSRDRL